jgi:hypothetical protein
LRFVRGNGARRNGPEFDEVLRGEEYLIALPKQAGQGLGGDDMLRGGRIGKAQQQIRVGEISSHQS